MKFSRCYRTRAVGKATATRKDSDTDSKALIANTVFHPERVKPVK